MGNSQVRAEGVRKKRIGRQRRLSEPEDDYSDNHLRPRSMKFSMSGMATPISVTPPRIQINGMESTEEAEEHELTRTKSRSMGRRFSQCYSFSQFRHTPERRPCASLLDDQMQRTVHFLNTIQEDLPSTTTSSHSASLRRMQFLSSNSSTNITARSLDDPRSIADLQMKPLSRAKSHSPLKQMRTYSYRSLSSEENALDKTACELIKSSWHEATVKAAATGRHFGYFVFQRVFQKDPTLKTVFGMKPDEEISDLPEDHECIRHTKIFTNIIHLAAKNVDELEPQVAPAIFKYGERHYNTKASEHMTEENVRMVCAQVVCTVCDLLGDDAHPQHVEAWIEMMRYLGRKLLDGHEYAKLTAKHRISINRNDHHLFLML